MKWVVGIVCAAGIARADAPIDGHVSLGASVVTNDAPQFAGYGEKTRAQVTLEGLVGVRLGRAVVGLHAGISTPLSFFAFPQHDSGEVVTEANSSIYPIDLGLGAQVDLGAGLWGAAWIGATLAFETATSPAQHISAIDFTGDIPDASWSESSRGLGYGATLGYVFQRRWAAVLTFTSRNIADIPFRDDDGTTRSETVNVAVRTLTLGAAYRY